MYTYWYTARAQYLGHYPSISGSPSWRYIIRIWYMPRGNLVYGIWWRKMYLYNIICIYLLYVISCVLCTRFPPRKCIMPVYLWDDSVCYLRHTAATTTASSHTDRLRQTAVSAAEPHARRPFGDPSSYTSRVSVWPFKLAFLSCRTCCTHYFFIIIFFFHDFWISVKISSLILSKQYT